MLGKEQVAVLDTSCGLPRAENEARERASESTLAPVTPEYDCALSYSLAGYGHDGHNNAHLRTN